MQELNLGKGKNIKSQLTNNNSKDILSFFENGKLVLKDVTYGNVGRCYYCNSLNVEHYVVYGKTEKMCYVKFDIVFFCGECFERFR